MRTVAGTLESNLGFLERPFSGYQLNLLFEAKIDLKGYL